MAEQFDDNDFEIILESLQYSKMRIENYPDYPSYEFKLSQLERVESALRKVKALARS